jgi:hypothetical protein
MTVWGLGTERAGSSECSEPVRTMTLDMSWAKFCAMTVDQRSKLDLERSLLGLAVRVGSVLVLVAMLPQVALAALSGEPSPGLRLAYLDPGTGSFVIQALVAAAAGLAVTLKLYWFRIKGFFGGSSSDKEDDDLSDGAA